MILSSRLILSSLRALAALVLPTLFLTSCFEQSVVIRVNKDGSGIVHERSYANDAMGGMMDGLIATGDPNVTVESTGAEIPSEDDLKEVATKMGEGVTFQSVKAGKNRSGWSGHEVVYAFTDINKLKFDMNNLGTAMEGGMEELGELGGPEAAEALEEANKEEIVKFEMADGVLKIITPDPSSSLNEAGGGVPAAPGSDGAPGETANPFGDLDPADPESAMAMQMMAGMMAGMRLGIFVQVADPIAQTNARHAKGNMITLMMMDMGKVFQNPANMAAFEGMENETDRAKLQEAIDGIDGMTADLQEPIVVEFQ